MWKNSILLLLAVVFGTACFKSSHPPRILVFTKTEGYRHANIPDGIRALREICRDIGVMMDTSENADDFTEANLKRYAAVVFFSTTGDVLPPAREADFERYIQAGGGFVGIHAATDTEYGWKWFGGLAGAYFNGHPAIQEATIQVHDHGHPSTRCLTDSTWIRTDEWYNFKEFNPAVNVLLKIDENSYQGGTMNGDHPLAWYHAYDGGRAFYTAMGHTAESFSEPLFRQHILGGIVYAIGNNDKLCYDNCRTERSPDPTRFVKTVLASDLNEPMEFDLFPDGKLVLIERRGAIKIFDPATGLLTVAAHLDVHDEHEDGLMGLALDPAWAENHWMYLYYAPPGKKEVNYLSRFKFAGDTLDRASEQIILEVAVQREECCHAGGSIEFGADGMLYLSTGDNTNPFASEGYAPIDERPGRSAWDAQKSSSNTMDLRGKILRVKLLADGSYVCPAGNLFTNVDVTVQYPDMPAEVTRAGRPEIYVMGCRNPFRISLDNRRRLLFWGEVGPDAGEPEPGRGPAGHDELNRARAAGFFGWPYFVGDNKAYHDHNFITQQSGAAFDPERPFNDSPNNTGSRTLPPAQPAMIWYPYGNSPDFPLLGNGGRNAMAGPVYYTDRYPAETRLPDYYDGKLLMYDWVRGWMMAVTLDSLGNFSRMEPFGEAIRLSRPMDMLIDPQGSVWVLEYGTQWFAKNPDARLSRIDYVRGNRPPIPVLQADRTEGAAPCAVVFSAAQSRDDDGDRLHYALDFGDGSPILHLEANRIKMAKAGSGTPLRRNVLDSLAHSYAVPGQYTAVLTATDTRGIKRSVKQVIQVGNEPPQVRWDLGNHNRSFYRPGDTLHYRVRVDDLEDGSLADGSIPETAIAISTDYMETGFDITSIAQGHQNAKKASEYALGKRLVEGSDCKTCHDVDRQINGPSWLAIASRYRNDDFAVQSLSQKVLKGGAGNWGQTVMSAHPQLPEDRVVEMVRWILSLGGPAKPQRTVPASGDYVLAIPPPKAKGQKTWPGTYILQATYLDKGNGSAKPLERTQVLALRPAFFQAEKADSLSRGITSYRPFKGDTVVLKDLKHRSFFVIRSADLRSVHSVAINTGSGDARYPFYGGRIELRAGGVDGVLLGAVAVPPCPPGDTMIFTVHNLPLQLPPGFDTGLFYDLYFVTKKEDNPSEPVTAVDWVRFDFLRENG